MEQEKIIQILNSFLIEEFEINADLIKPEALLKEDLGLESLDFVDIAVIIEKEFGLKVKGVDMIGVHTLQDLYDYIFRSIPSN
jgi:acyl carrier protein